MWLLLLLTMSGCSIMMGPHEPASAKDTFYQLSFKAENWKLKEDRRSDYIWMNSLDGRILLSNSFCHEFQDQSLEVLAVKTFNTVSDLKILKKESTTFHGREAYAIEGTGKVDGVGVKLKLLNTRRNNCYFDFVSITPQIDQGHESTEFESFLQSVVFK